VNLVRYSTVHKSPESNGNHYNIPTDKGVMHLLLFRRTYLFVYLSKNKGRKGIENVKIPCSLKANEFSL